MLTAKIISIVLTLFAALGEHALDYKWRDKRTKAFARLRNSLLAIYTLGAIVSVILVVVDDQKSDRVVANLSEIKDSLSVQAAQSTRRELEAISSFNKVSSELIDLKNSLSPFQKLASSKFPKDPPELALSKLAKGMASLQMRTSRLEQSTAAISTQDVFRPISSQIRNQVLNSLRALKSQFANRLKEVSLYCENGSRARQLFTQQLMDLMKSAGLPVQGVTSGTSFFSGTPPPIQMELNNNDLDMAESLAKVLSPILKTQFSGIKNDKNPKNQISISVFGTPIFSGDGSTEIR
ncbi:MAG: hypothetical protein KGJ59_01635 [Bacteroidota bacterium]|nr:hypothetical protein [Bacteroidota bacterium]